MRRIILILAFFQVAFALDNEAVDASKGVIIESLQNATNIYAHAENLLPDIGLLVSFTSTITDARDDEEIVAAVASALTAFGFTLEGLAPHEWVLVQFRTSKPPYETTFTYTVKSRPADGVTEVWRDDLRLW